MVSLSSASFVLFSENIEQKGEIGLLGSIKDKADANKGRTRL